MQAAYFPNPPVLMGASFRVPGVPWLAQTANPFIYEEADGWQSPQNEREWRGFFPALWTKVPFSTTKANCNTPNTLVMFSLTTLSLMFLVSFPLMAAFTHNAVVSPAVLTAKYTLLWHSSVINEHDNHAFYDFLTSSALTNMKMWAVCHLNVLGPFVIVPSSLFPSVWIWLNCDKTFWCHISHHLWYVFVYFCIALVTVHRGLKQLFRLDWYILICIIGSRMIWESLYDYNFQKHGMLYWC